MGAQSCRQAIGKALVNLHGHHRFRYIDDSLGQCAEPSPNLNDDVRILHSNVLTNLGNDISIYEEILAEAFLGANTDVRQQRSYNA